MPDIYNNINPEIVTDKFGLDELVVAHADPNRVKRLVEEGCPVTTNALLAASFGGCEQTVEVLLAVLPDANARLNGAHVADTATIGGPTAHDFTPRFLQDRREWYPLQLANFGLLSHSLTRREASTCTTKTLLSHGAQLFALFRQPLRPSYPFPCSRPAETQDDCAWHFWDPDPDYTDSELESYSGDFSDSQSVNDGEWRKEPRETAGYGLRSVLHSFLEDGANLEFFFDVTDDIELETRDPQGKTLIHAACRNAVGADARPDAILWDIWNNIPPYGKGLIAPDASETSIFHRVRKAGADLEAVDNNGKSILHHLLEAHTPEWTNYNIRTPLICNTLKYVLRALPQLINQPDRYGTYPLHVALQRLRGPIEWLAWFEDSPLEEVVHELLDAGADATTTDSRGNTVLHYLADNGLAAQVRGQKPRSICNRVCNAGVDVNLRNKEGWTVLEILLADNGVLNHELLMRNLRLKEDRPPCEEIDEEIFATLDKSGVIWTGIDARGRTLLHFACMHETPYTKFRVEYLLGKGISPDAKDMDGNTASDIAVAAKNNAALAALRIDH